MRKPTSSPIRLPPEVARPSPVSSRCSVRLSSNTGSTSGHSWITGSGQSAGGGGAGQAGWRAWPVSAAFGTTGTGCSVHSPIGVQAPTKAARRYRRGSAGPGRVARAIHQQGVRSIRWPSCEQAPGGASEQARRPADPMAKLRASSRGGKRASKASGRSDGQAASKLQGGQARRQGVRQIRWPSSGQAPGGGTRATIRPEMLEAKRPRLSVYLYLPSQTKIDRNRPRFLLGQIHLSRAPLRHRARAREWPCC